MASKNHPKFAEWDEAFDDWKAAILAKSEGRAEQADVDESQARFDMISNGISSA